MPEPEYRALRIMGNDRERQMADKIMLFHVVPGKEMGKGM